MESKATVLWVPGGAPETAALDLVLSSTGARVLKAASADEARRFLERLACDLLILDSDSEGAEAIAPDLPVPVLLLTGTPRTEAGLVRRFTGGLVDYLEKPVTPAELGRRVSLLLAQSQRRAERGESRGSWRRRERRRREALMEASAEAVWSSSRKGDLLAGAGRFSVFTGLPAGAGHWLDAVHPDDRVRAEHAWREAVTRGERFEIECRVRRASGDWGTVRLNAVPVKEGGAPAQEWIIASTDVTFRRREEWGSAFLARASAMLGASLEVDATVRTVVDLTVPELADWAAADLVGQDGVIRRLAVANQDPRGVARVRELDARYPVDPNAPFGQGAVIRTGEPEWSAEIPDDMLVMVSRDEEMLRILRELGLRSYICVPLRNRGQVFGALTLVYSNSGRRYAESDLRLVVDLAHRAAVALDNAQLYRQAQEAVRLQDEFLSVASHELKTPLTPLQLRLTGIQRSIASATEASRDQVEAHLVVAQRQVKRLANLINNLLDVSRISAGTLRFTPENLDLVDVAREVVARFQGQAALAGSALIVEAPNVLRGTWDRTALEQILNHLIANALKYGAGRPVTVSVREGEEADARLEVRDEGIGISPEYLERIFLRFERGVSDKNYGGLGLGLYIARHLAEQMGGEIQVESVPGGGARFQVLLPRAVKAGVVVAHAPI